MSGQIAVDRAVLKVISRRGIVRLLHFTTNRGLLGIIATGAIKSRASLEEDQYVEYLFTPNAETRKDLRWAGHVSLSVSRMNTSFLSYSRASHVTEDIWWCVLAIEPEILGHEGVRFCTINNIWPSVSRGTSGNGLESMFAEVVIGRYQKKVRRHESMLDRWPTELQAEVLYLGEISTDYVQGIYVRDPMHSAVAQSYLSAIRHRRVEIVLDPEVFRVGEPSR